eukprot:5101380-Alexandrium_andersonii.AAC.1
MCPGARAPPFQTMELRSAFSWLKLRRLLGRSSLSAERGSRRRFQQGRRSGCVPFTSTGPSSCRLFRNMQPS